jgi:hypothetical protein
MGVLDRSEGCSEGDLDTGGLRGVSVAQVEAIRAVV